MSLLPSGPVYIFTLYPLLFQVKNIGGVAELPFCRPGNYIAELIRKCLMNKLQKD